MGWVVPGNIYNSPNRVCTDGVRSAGAASVALLIGCVAFGLCLSSLVHAHAASVVKWQSTIVAGTGEKGFSGDGGPATKAQLNNPFGVVRGPDGAIYICDTSNHRIRKVGADGNISTVAGSGRPGYSGDGASALQAELNEPYEIRFDKGGNMFFVEMKNNIVRRVDAGTRMISTVAGNGKAGFSGDGGPATNAMLKQPHSIQFAPNGEIYICDIANHRIRQVNLKTGIITTFAGNGEQVVRLPITGNETVLDGISQIGGLSAVSSKKVWIARPAPASPSCPKVSIAFAGSRCHTKSRGSCAARASPPE